MIVRPRHAPLVAHALALLPATAQAEDAPSGVIAPVMAPVAQTVTANGGGVSLTARPEVSAGRATVVRGNAAPSAAG